MASPEYITYGQSWTRNNTSLSIRVPSDIATGDIVVNIVNLSSTRYPTLPAGYTSVLRANSINISYAVWGVDTTTALVTMSGITYGDTVNYVQLHIRPNASPLHVVCSPVKLLSGTTQHPTPDVTGQVSAEWLSITGTHVSSNVGLYNDSVDYTEIYYTNRSTGPFSVIASYKESDVADTTIYGSIIRSASAVFTRSWTLGIGTEGSSGPSFIVDGVAGADIAARDEILAGDIGAVDGIDV